MTILPRLRLGVSACLLGENVRYDGTHKRDPRVADILAREFELVPVCPEVGIGLGVPRPPIQLEGDRHNPRAIGVEQRDLDATEALLAFGRHTAATLELVSGFILKNRSPSCGLSVTVHLADGTTCPNGTGLFARALLEALPGLPVEEHESLADPVRLRQFVERVRLYGRLRA